MDVVWGKERPPRPQEKIKSLSLEYAGKKAEEKIDDLRKELDKKKSAGLIICIFANDMCDCLLLIQVCSYA